MRVLRSLLLISFSLNICIATFGQSDSLSRPYLNGHRFVVNTFVDDPFMYTSFNLMMGYGSSSGYEFPPIQIGDYELNISSGELFFGSLLAGYSQQINDWATAYVSFGFSGRFGAEPTSILTQGFNSITGVNYGMKFNVLRTRKSMLTTEFRVKNYGISYINVFKYLKDLIEENPNADITQTANILAGHLGGSYAYAHNELWGFYTSAKYFFGDSMIPGETINELNLAFAFDLNLYSRTKIPIGLNLGISSTTLPEFTLARTSRSTIYSFQIAYVGRENLQFGLSSSFFETPLEVEGVSRTDGLATTVSNLSFVMRYFF